jgi:trk system potassium uptake protein TrkH
MTPFDAICHSMTTLSTGGFSTHDASFGYWDSGFIHMTTTVFMLLGGTSFVILHRALTQGVAWSGSPELRAYFAIFAVATLLIAVDIRSGMSQEFGTAADALQHAVFQAASIVTTSGFSTTDFDLWPYFSHALLLGLFFCGGMAGSTSGGVKVVRIVVMLHVAFSQFFTLVHPRGYGAIKLGERTVEEDVIRAFTATAVSLGNIGPGFGEVGPTKTYAPFSSWVKVIMATLMILGRLEIYTVLVILTPGFWRR